MGVSIANPETQSPPLPALAFRVGVVGHRPNRLNASDPIQLSQVIRDVLTAVKEEVSQFKKDHRGLFADPNDPPLLRAVSPLAEGSDRLFVEQALHLGYALCCPMPFAKEEFENDFLPGLEPDSLNRFRRLLARAAAETSLSVFELDGSRANEGLAYGAGGQIVLNQSDLLVVVWDGRHLEKPGGTEETFADARRRGVPIVWIDAHSPHVWQLLDDSALLPNAQIGARAVPAVRHTMADLKKRIRGTLDLPPPQSGDQVEPLVALKDFFAESKPRTNPAVVWKCFRDVVGDSRWPKLNWKVEDFEDAVLKEWPTDESTAAARVVNRLRPFYAWPDKLAVLYSDTYRSAFVLAFLLSAIAVGLALLPLAASWFDGTHRGAEATCILAELAAISTILFLVGRGRRRRWHERWIDYRLVAELVRHMRLVVSLGGGRSFPSPPAHLATYGHPGATWMAWYVRAVERDLGLMSATMNTVQLQECVHHLLALLDGQRRWHETTAKRCDRIEKRLHGMGVVLLGVTLLAVGLHFGFSVAPLEPPHWLPRGLTFLCGFLPALGAALYGISNQGEFRRIEKRSRAMVGQLGPLCTRAEKMKADFGSGRPQGAPLSRHVVALATDVAQLMANEVLDWRVVFLDRPLTT